MSARGCAMSSLLVFTLMSCQVQSQLCIWVWGVTASKATVATGGFYLLEDA